jgi:TolB-like protein
MGLLAAVVVLIALAGGALVLNRTRSAAGASHSPAINSIAVLPLENLSGDAASDYFSDGLTESLINELSKISQLKIISRSSAFTFKGKAVDPRDVGKQLGVAAILEGSVRKEGDSVRVQTRLVSTEDGRVIWVGDTFDRAFKDILTVQDEIGCHVAAQLRVRLCAEDPPHKRYTDKVEAFEAYLQGRYYWNQRTPEGVARSIDYYQKAIAIDPHYALAYAGLTESYIERYWLAQFDPQETIAKSMAAASKAGEMDDQLAEAHIAMGRVYQLAWNWAEATREDQRAIELNPRSARAHHVYAFQLSAMGRYDEAIAEMKLARELDPLNVAVQADVAMILWDGRRIDEAFDECLKAVEMAPNFAEAHQYLSVADWLKGRSEDSVAEDFRA